MNANDAVKRRLRPAAGRKRPATGVVQGAPLIADRGNDRILLVDPAHRILWPGVRGSAPGLPTTPDDAYPLPNGEVAVADAYNCRVVWIRDHRIVRQLGRTGVCAHDPPRTFGAVNSDTPLRDGGMLISEIPGHWIDEVGPSGGLRWSVQAPVRYPTDPQLLTHGRMRYRCPTRTSRCSIRRPPAL